MTHIQYILQHPPTSPCDAYHITFGGHCLNCGWRPPETPRNVPPTKEEMFGKKRAAMEREVVE